MDPLRKYRQKRKFTETPEPEGSNNKTPQHPLRFVIHKHAASRLHYDLRLESDGVLKSWAVPKGPSLNPLDRHLAIHVEDHPFDYKDFEGIIPEGNYGAGPVMIWDEGFYEPLGPLASSPNFFEEGLKKGHLVFALAGKKLNGEFALIQLKRGAKQDWLLIKARDSYSNEKDILKNDRSARSGYSMEEIKKGKLLSLDSIRSSPKSTTPHLVKPMMATLIDQPFDDPEWLFEIKWDGYRTLTEIEGGMVKLYSRNGNDFSKKFLEITNAFRDFSVNAVFDGEIVALDNQGRSSFQLLQDYQLTGQGTLVYYVFDIIHYGNHDLTQLSLDKRREILKKILPNKPEIKFSDDVRGLGRKLFSVAHDQGLEGIMAKRVKSTYQIGKRSRDWQKIKHHDQQEAIICGFTKPRGSRLSFGALLLGIYKNDELVYIGDVGTGFDEDLIKLVMQKMQPLVTTESPFDNFQYPTKNITWVRPELVCEVKFQEWTKDGRMRQPVFLGLREDKSPREVHKEITKATPLEINNNKSSANDFKHPNKIFWPELGITKGDLLTYYQTVSKYLIPHLLDRPVTLHRFPDGINGEHFYQKNIEKPPKWMKIYDDSSEAERRVIHYPICNDEETLRYLINLGCIDLNVWNSTIEHPTRPDFMVFDLDPVEIDFHKVLEAALTVKKALDEIGLSSYPKTSGKRGLHIYTPLNHKYSYDQVRDFAHLVALKVNQKLPTTTSLERMPSKRKGKVYLDYLQNRKGATMSSPYSVRPTSAASVSAPVSWEEVKNGLNPEDFTMDVVIKRLTKFGDIFTPVLAGDSDLEKALRKMPS